MTQRPDCQHCSKKHNTMIGKLLRSGSASTHKSGDEKNLTILLVWSIDCMSWFAAPKTRGRAMASPQTGKGAEALD